MYIGFWILRTHFFIIDNKKSILLISQLQKQLQILNNVFISNNIFCFQGNQ